MFTDIFIKRPVLAVVISLLMFFVGLASIFTLQLRQYPKTTKATITINTAYPGASANVIQGFLTTPIEQAVGTVDGIDYLTSTSSNGSSKITANLELNYPPEKAMTDISQKVSSVQSQLPPQAESPAITKQSTGDMPQLILSFTSDTLSTNQITAYLKNQLRPTIFSLGGISEFLIMGQQPYAMRIWLNPGKMALMDVSPNEVMAALQKNSMISSSGKLKSDFQIIPINAKTSLSSAAEYENLVISNKNGYIVRLKDVADVQLGSRYHDRFKVTMNDKAGVSAGIKVSPEANSLSVIKNVQNHLPEIQKSLPKALKMEQLYDATKFIRVSIDDVINTIIEAIIIVIIVMLIFLGSFRATIIPLVTIPLSLVGVFFLMQLMGFSINLLTLLAMVLAIGLVVDDAIIVLENIYRHLESGLTSFQSAIKGAREIMTPIITMTLTLSAVYAPIGMMGGLTGALFTEFAYTLAATVILSGIIGLTLSPMMCSKIVSKQMLEGRVVKWVDAVFSRLSSGYSRALNKVLQYRPPMVLFALVVLISCYYLFTSTKSELAPTEDKGFIATMASAQTSANLNYLTSFSPAIGDIANALPQADNYFTVDGYPSQNKIFGGIMLKPWDQRDKTQMQLTPLVQSKLKSIPGIQAYAYQMPSLPGIPGGLPIQFVLKSNVGYEKINAIMDQLIKKANQSGLFLLTKSNLRFDKKTLNVTIDRQKAADMNIPVERIANTLQTAFSNNYANFFTMQGYSFRVIPQLEDQFRKNAKQLQNIRIKTDAGKMVPLKTLVDIQYDTRPSNLKRFQQLNSATFQAMPAPGTTQGQIYSYLQNTAQQIMPRTMETGTKGSLRQFIQEGNTLLWAFLFAIIVIFLLLAAQFESYRDPFIILITVPLSICGALIPTYLLSLFGVGYATINIYTQVGLVTLIGLISKHGILMVEFANQLQDEGIAKMKAIKQAASIRLRPILMTTAAMVFGVIPLMTASGAGAASRNAIGLIIFFGLSIGTLFTLFVIPVIYSYLAKDRQIMLQKMKEQKRQIDELENEASDSS